MVVGSFRLCAAGSARCVVSVYIYSNRLRSRLSSAPRRWEVALVANECAVPVTEPAGEPAGAAGRIRAHLRMPAPRLAHRPLVRQLGSGGLVGVVDRLWALVAVGHAGHALDR